MTMPDDDDFDRLFAVAVDRLCLFLDLRMGPALRARLEADDVLQDVYLEGRRAFGTEAPRDARGFAAWMCRIVENCLRGHADHFGAKKRREPGPAIPISAVRDAARLSATGPVTAAARGEAHDRLRAALQTLAEDERDLVLRRFFAEQNLADIATATGRSETSVRRILARATTRLGVEVLSIGGSR